MTTKKLQMDGSREIAYVEKTSQESDVGIIVLHGLAEHKGRYEEFLNELHALKYSVFSLDLLGHGESSGPRGEIGAFMEYVEELDAFYSFIKNRYPRMRIGMFGHSLGGLVVCWHAHRTRDVEFIVLSSPLLKRKRILGLLKYLPCRALGSIKIKKRLSESREMLERSRNDPLSCDYLTLGLLGEVFIAGIDGNLEKMRDIEMPVLLLGGREDNLVDPAHLEHVIHSFGSREKSLKIYDGVKHRLVHSPRKEEIIKDIHDWINKRMKS